ncbi:MAG: hypothetical protein LBO21_02685 [Synergistaceae bacterium]|nr:hypothetical protein [Synergistaceae bacterium]
MSVGKRYAKQVLLLSVVSSLLFLLSFAMNQYYERNVTARQSMNQTVMTLLFQWMGYFFITQVCLVIPVIVRYLIYARPLTGKHALLASLVNYPTIEIILAMPYQLVIGRVTHDVPIFVALCAARMAAAVFCIAACRIMLVIPDNEDVDAAVSLDDYTRCVSELGKFINLVKASLRDRFPAENLWRAVLAYLKNGATIKKAIREKGVHHDEIVLNAVGSIAFRLLSSGGYNVSAGVLSKEGEYLKEIWRLAAHELVRRRYNTPDDMARGLAALHSLTARPLQREA